MRVLVNYEASEKLLLPTIAGFLKRENVQAIASSNPMHLAELLSIAKDKQVEAIILCNETTLRNVSMNKKATLDGYRGSRFNFSTPILVVNKINHVHTVNHGGFLLGKDLEKLRTIHQKATPFSFTLLDKPSLFPKYLELFSKAVLISYDIETVTLNENEKELKAGDTIITCVSYTILLPTGVIRTYVLPLVNFTEEFWVKQGDYEKAITFMQKANKLDVPKVMHNGMYDSMHSIIYHAEPHNFALDTMAMAHSEYAELPKSLDFVASMHCYDYVQWEDESEDARKTKDMQKYWGYNAKDTWYTMRVAISQLKNMPAYARRNYSDKFKLVYACLYCGFEGFKIDIEVQDRVRDEAQIKLDKARSLLQTYVADPNFNPGSWQQVEKYIYKVFGAIKPKIGKSKSGTDEKNLSAVADQHPLLALLTSNMLDYREAQKAIGTYFNFLQKNKRLLWTLNPFGAETERMSCNASSLWCGTQVQNIPYYAKKFLIADEGFTILEADNKQSEGRCTAYCAQDEDLIKALEDPVYDFYKTLGTLFFQMPYEEVTDFFRNKVLKRIVHGTNYVMGAKTFKDNIGAKILHQTASILGFKLVPKPSSRKPEEKTIIGFCKELLDKYHVPFPRIRKWYKELELEVKTTGQIKSPLGHVRKFFGDITKNHNIFRSAVAHQPQNLSGAILNIGFWKIYKHMVVEPILPLKLGDVRLKAQIHDSNMLQAKDEHVELVKTRMLEYMDNPVTVHGRILRIPVDINTGKSWKG